MAQADTAICKTHGHSKTRVWSRDFCFVHLHWCLLASMRRPWSQGFGNGRWTGKNSGQVRCAVAIRCKDRNARSLRKVLLQDLPHHESDNVGLLHTIWTSLARVVKIQGDTPRWSCWMVADAQSWSDKRANTADSNNSRNWNYSWEGWESALPHPWPESQSALTCKVQQHAWSMENWPCPLCWGRGVLWRWWRIPRWHCLWWWWQPNWLWWRWTLLARRGMGWCAIHLLWLNSWRHACKWRSFWYRRVWPSLCCICWQQTSAESTPSFTWIFPCGCSRWWSTTSTCCFLLSLWKSIAFKDWFKREVKG